MILGLARFRFAVAAALTGTFSAPEATLHPPSFSSQSPVSFAGSGSHEHGTALKTGSTGGRVKKFISLLIPFGAYELAEHLGGSGIQAAAGGRHDH